MLYDPIKVRWALKVSLLTNKELHLYKFYNPAADVWFCDPLSNETFDGNSVVRTSHILRIAEQEAQGDSYVLHGGHPPPLEPSYPLLAVLLLEGRVVTAQQDSASAAAPALPACDTCLPRVLVVDRTIFLPESPENARYRSVHVVGLGEGGGPTSGSWSQRCVEPLPPAPPSYVLSPSRPPLYRTSHVAHVALPRRRRLGRDHIPDHPRAPLQVLLRRRHSMRVCASADDLRRARRPQGGAGGVRCSARSRCVTNAPVPRALPRMRVCSRVGAPLL